MELDELGLVPDEAAVYRMLIARTSVRAEVIGDAAGLPAERADAALHSLVARGLVVRAADGHRYSAAPPPSRWVPSSPRTGSGCNAPS